ncbi:hypothetical protein [Bradyrhizobium sp. SYSU BS000235]|uniref:hypothetical protein n=1 Tax=Bradyrhizobium sp. SYSU BS000235 TaxID=3411332 RepID=UPI003C74FDAC
MTQFQTILGHFGYSRFAPPVAYGSKPPVVLQLAPTVNPAHERVFQGFRPSYHTAVGLRTAVLDKVTVYPANGRTYAYYSIVYIHPITRKRERLAWRYKVVNGLPMEDKAFPVSSR